jgi:hypothetical protein
MTPSAMTRQPRLVTRRVNAAAAQKVAAHAGSGRVLGMSADVVNTAQAYNQARSMQPVMTGNALSPRGIKAFLR